MSECTSINENERRELIVGRFRPEESVAMPALLPVFLALAQIQIADEKRKKSRPSTPALAFYIPPVFIIITIIFFFFQF